MTATLTTERLVLRPFGDDHLTAVYIGWLNNPKTMRYSELRHHRHDRESCKKHLAGLRAGGHHFWAIEQRGAARAHIGNITAYLDPANATAEVSILVGDAASRGRGLGAEAWCAVVDHLITDTPVRLVHAGTMAVNTGMLRVFEKSGMQVEARLPARFLLDGAPVDLVMAARHSDHAEGDAA